MTAAGTGAAGIAWVNWLHLVALKLGLVLDKDSQLGERPAMQCSSLSLAYRYPITNTAKFFNGDPPVGVFGFFYNAFANVVVNPSGKAPLFARKLFKTATARMRTFLLKFLAQAALPKTNVFDGLALVYIAITIDGNVSNAQVNAKKIVNVLCRGFVHFTGGKQVKLTVNQAKVRFATFARKQFFRSRMTDERQALNTTVNRPNGNLVPSRASLVEFPRQDTAIESDTAKWFELSLRLFVQLVGVSHFGDATNNKLGSQVKLSFNVRVNKLLNLEFAKGLGIPRDLTDKVTSSIGFFQCALQAISLCICGLKFDLRSQYHVIHFITVVIFYQATVLVGVPSGTLPAIAGAQFPPRVNYVGFLAQRIVTR